MDFPLQRLLKALLFSTSEPLAIKDVQTVITRWHQSDQAEASDPGEEAPEEGQAVMRDVIEQVPSLVTAAQIREALEALQHEAEEHDEVYRLQEGPHGYRLVVSPRYADWVRLLRDEPRPQRLSNAAMETLAIVAYRQPVTRSEIEAIRGVAADNALNRLLERELVYVSGRADLPGRPLQYSTTERFLEFCGIRGLDELPASDVLNPQQLTQWVRQATSAPEEMVSDEDMGLPGVERPDDHNESDEEDEAERASPAATQAAPPVAEDATPANAEADKRDGPEDEFTDADDPNAEVRS